MERYVVMRVVTDPDANIKAYEDADIEFVICRDCEDSIFDEYGNRKCVHDDGVVDEYDGCTRGWHR